jgi:hypothetical protein
MAVEQQAEPTVMPIPTSTLTDQPTNTPMPTPEPTQTPLMTQQEALATATPIIEQYASENNRTITSIKANFNPKLQDITGTREENSITKNHSAFTPDQYISSPSYPAWMIEATFEPLHYTGPNGTLPDGIQYYTYGYFVNIWAENKQIFDHGANGIC